MNREMSVEIASEDPTPDPNEISCDLQNVFDSLTRGLIGSDDVELGAYLTAYRELYNFFVLLGGAFAFVASDVKNKIKILEDFRALAKNGEFDTVAKMMAYEMGENLLAEKKYVSGSRTLLRLHRGLDFVQQFLAEMYKLEDSKGTGGVCREAYDKTLGNFHPWAVRKGAQLAMKLLPTKKDLIRKIAKDDPAVALKTLAIMPDMLGVVGQVYLRVDELYTKNKLHELP